MAVDWSNTQFVASAMTADGTAYGIVEPRPGRFREEDLLTLTGAPLASFLQTRFGDGNPALVLRNRRALGDLDTVAETMADETLLVLAFRNGEAIAALRTAAAINPLGGTSWWEIANLKIARFFDADIAQMRQALAIERRWSKDQILELYLNEIYLGLGAYGIAAASLVYFDKSVNELTVAEAGYLAALPKAPSTLHPVKHCRVIPLEPLPVHPRRQFGWEHLDDYLSAERVLGLPKLR